MQVQVVRWRDELVLAHPLVIYAKLVEDSEAVWQQVEAGPNLWRNLTVRLEDDKVNVESLEDVGQREAGHAAAGYDDFEVSVDGRYGEDDLTTTDSELCWLAGVKRNPTSL